MAESFPSVEVFWESHKHLQKSAFVRANPSPFLVSSEGVEPVAGDRDFETVTSGSATDRARFQRSLQVTLKSRVVPVKKDPKQPFPDKITVGRTVNNDLVLRHASVSKFHAYFARRGEVWTITEAGSRNASKHNGVRITSELAPRAVNDRDVLQFGAAPEMLWVHAATLLDLLEWQRSPNAEG